MKNFFLNKRVLITGACGTIGTELINQLMSFFDPSEIIGIDNNESGLFLLNQKYSDLLHVNFILADIRDHDKLLKLFKGIDIVFHTAALKHVVLCEQSPFEAIQTNILGLRNVIDAANQANVEKVIFTSSDKAVNPTNVMGTSKLMGERLITAANSMNREKGPVFASTRFGNVLGSRGSVIPLFKNQISNGGPVTLTHPEMTRFIMSISEAVRLVIDSAMLARGGEVFVTKMPTIRIIDLAEVMIEKIPFFNDNSAAKAEIIIVGQKPGEKLYEELINQEELRRTWELERYFVVLPALRSIYREVEYDYPGIINEAVDKVYISAEEVPMSKTELLDFISSHGVLDVCEY